MRIALRDINKQGVEIGERQNRCHNNSLRHRGAEKVTNCNPTTSCLLKQYMTNCPGY